ncbi:MAG: hypothetical protein CIT01_05815 [Methanobacterium sp. BRmetb2]|nr:MAG: hypothetical protein CIT01_05815 [Methanobacterium sp. BRmetb2]
MIKQNNLNCFYIKIVIKKGYFCKKDIGINTSIYPNIIRFKSVLNQKISFKKVFLWKINEKL